MNLIVLTHCQNRIVRVHGAYFRPMSTIGNFNTDNLVQTLMIINKFTGVNQLKLM